MNVWYSTGLEGEICVECFEKLQYWMVFQSYKHKKQNYAAAHFSIQMLLKAVQISLV